MRTTCSAAWLLFATLTLSSPARAQAPHQHGAPADTVSAAKDAGTSHGMGHVHTPGMDMSGMDMSEPMNGMYGAYPMSREASGTAWQPEAAEHTGLHLMRGDWMLMLHGSANLVYDYQGGLRGDEQVFSDNMLMAMAQRSAGPGTFGVRTMVSLEPSTIGKDGYPLLLQTGETADGSTPLIDRQHPHDLFMELAGTYSIASGSRSLFVYAGLPGEPALGPPAFMHRFSGMSIPQAPITHHWLDSSHITWGVLTAGAVVDRIKVEASAFRGRESDENRWDFESPKLDSHSFRLSFNPTKAWAFQVSHGRIASPEQLEPDLNVDRTTASAMFEGRWSGGHWQSTVAWGRNRNRPGRTLDAFTAEAAVRLGEAHTLMARAERAQKDELFLESDPRAGELFEVGELSVGYRCDFWRGPHLATGLGVLGTMALVPSDLEDAYGSQPRSILVFAHVELR